MLHTPHQQKPDLDNLEKSLGDACYGDDSCIWNMWAAKFWGLRGEIWIGENTEIPIPLDFLSTPTTDEK